MRAELSIVRESDRSGPAFRPAKFYVSPSLLDQRASIGRTVNQIQRGVTYTDVFGGSKTLHILSAKECLACTNAAAYALTASCLDEIADLGLGHFGLSQSRRRLVSLCFHGLCFGAGKYAREKLDDLASMVNLCGGEFVENSETEKMTHYVTDFPVIPRFISSSRVDIEVVTSEWVCRCFREGRCRKVESPAPFGGLVFTSSDLESRESRELKQLVVSNGGSWHDAYDDSIQFLVSRRLAMTPKVKLALSAGVPIVKPDWIRAQVQCLVSPEDFTLNFWCFTKERSRLFAGKMFAIHVDCEQRDCVIEAVKANSGKFSDRPDFLIVPHFYQETSSIPAVTATWLWCCISEQRLVPRDSALVFSQFPFDKPSGDLKGYVVALYKMNDSERYYLAEGLRCLGVTVHFRVSEYSNIVVAESLDDDLVRVAQRYDISVVRTTWAIALLKTGKLPSARAFIHESGKDRSIDKICLDLQRSVSKDGSSPIVRPPKDVLTSQSLATFSDEETEMATSPRITVAYDARNIDPNSSQGDVSVDPLMSMFVN